MNQLTMCLKQKETHVHETEGTPCKLCQNIMINCNFCVECRKPVFAKCIHCVQKELVDLHEFCYCQIELYSSNIF